MLKLTCKIDVKGSKSWTFDKIAAVEVELDSEKLTDTCTITMPKKVKWHGESSIPLKRGDKVTVALGYDGDNAVVFHGYISTIGAKTPIVVSCEDEMWKLKSVPAVKKTYKTVDIETLLKEQNTGYTIKVFGEQQLGAYRVNVDTVAELLNNLKEQGIRSFFKYDGDTPILYVGVLFKKQGSCVQVFDNRRNMTSDDDLEVRAAADMKLKIKAVSLDANNKKTTCEVGDSDGEVRTIHAYAKSDKELKAWAEQELKRLKRDGLTGSFEVFGAVLVDKLDTIGIILDGVKKGQYQVVNNNITYNTGGLRQKIEIGDRVDTK